MAEKPIIRANNGTFKPGTAGRQPGPNKLTRTVKETVLAVFNDLQADPEVNLLKWAQSEPTEFYKIAAKLIPTDIKADVTAMITVEPVTGMVIKKKDAA